MNTISRILGPSITLLCPLVGSSEVLLPWIGSDFRNRTGSSTMYHQNVEVYSHSSSYILAILLCICIIKANEHYHRDFRALHHTVVSTCWQFSCLRLGQIFEIELALRQCITKTWRYTATLLLVYW